MIIRRPAISYVAASSEAAWAGAVALLVFSGEVRQRPQRMSVQFRRTWCGTDLGEFRRCKGTYERYPLETVPRLEPDMFEGDFSWLGAPGEVDTATRSLLESLDRALGDHGLGLPPDFVRFYGHKGLKYALDEVSVTGCWTTISETPIPSPAEAGAFLVRFFNDQQDCCTWYLYLRPGEAPFVVHSYGLEFEEPPPDEAAAGIIEWCAASFEEFAYRYWVECTLWKTLHSKSPLRVVGRFEDYLSHYRSGA